jgi:hypothetical protein
MEEFITPIFLFGGLLLAFVGAFILSAGAVPVGLTMLIIGLVAVFLSVIWMISF